MEISTPLFRTSSSILRQLTIDHSVDSDVTRDRLRTGLLDRLKANLPKFKEGNSGDTEDANYYSQLILI